jgi:hypothetical protein
MTKIMTFAEAALIMKEGDSFMPEGNEDYTTTHPLRLYHDGEIFYYKCGSIKKVTLSPIHFKLKGRIITAEPKVLSDEEAKEVWKQKYYPHTSADNEGIYREGFSDGDKNGQLREWQRPEQVELRKAAQDFVWSSCGTTKLKNALENLKPPYECDQWEQ